MLPKDHVRRVVSLPRKLRKLFGWAVIRHRVSKSTLVVIALRKYFKRMGVDAVARPYARQLDDILKRLEPIQRCERAEYESLRLLAEYLLEVFWPYFGQGFEHRPEGRERFAEFKKRVHRQVAGGRITALNEDWESVLDLSDPLPRGESSANEPGRKLQPQDALDALKIGPLP